MGERRSDGIVEWHGAKPRGKPRSVWTVNKRGRSTMPDVANGFGELARGWAPLIITLETVNTKDEPENIPPQPPKMVGVSDLILASFPPASQKVLRLVLS